MIKNQSLLENGYIIIDFSLENCVLDFVKNRQWKELDNYFLSISEPEKPLHKLFKAYLDYNFLEHIIAIRSAPNDEEGIWHDDGSRLLGFSLSLNINPESIAGGELCFKKKEVTGMENFKPLPFGKMIIFLSGIYGYEHKVTAVTSGERIVIAGWCR